MSSRQRKWKPAGYIGLSKTKSCVVIKAGGEYYVAEVPEVLEVLTKQRGYAKIYKKTS